VLDVIEAAARLEIPGNVYMMATIPQKDHDQRSICRQVLQYIIHLIINIFCNFSKKRFYSKEILEKMLHQAFVNNCLCLANTKPSDVLTVLYGGKVLYVLRSHGDMYECIGDAFCDGLMEGEVLKDPIFKEQEFVIV